MQWADVRPRVALTNAITPSADWQGQ
jgi:hypothetical protein